jgi:hypothetical protein
MCLTLKGVRHIQKHLFMEWFALLIPVFAAIILIGFFHKNITWWEPLLGAGVSAIVIFVMKITMQTFMYTDTEWWSAPIVRATYYEDWNEYVHQTCTRTCCCDSKGQNCRTETYDCSYVRYHPEYWEIEDAIGNVLSVSQHEFERLCKRFGNRVYVDMSRNYHTDDGDAYTTTWGGKDENLEISVTSHWYENRVAVTNTVFQFREVDDSTKSKLALFDYPSTDDNHKQPSVLTHVPLKNLSAVQHEMNCLNARLGPSAQLKAWVLIWQGGTINTGVMQQHYWKGGNKNEMVITLGVDNKGKPIWCHPFSWTEKHDDEIRIRDWVLSQDSTMNILSMIQMMRGELGDFQRKNFDDFSYLTADLTATQITWIFIITILINIGVCWWIVNNEFGGSEMYSHVWSSSRTRFSSVLEKIRIKGAHAWNTMLITFRK